MEPATDRLAAIGVNLLILVTSGRRDTGVIAKGMATSG